MLIDDAVVDLVRDQSNASLTAVLRQRLQFCCREHRPGRIGRMRDDQPARARAFAVDQSGCGLISLFRSRSQVHRHDADRRENVPIRRIAGARECDTVADIEGSQEAQQKSRRGTRGDRHSAPIHIHTVTLAVIERDSVAQFGQPERLRITHGMAVQRTLGSLDHRFGSAAARLSDFEVQNIAPRHRPFIGHAQHIERDKGVNATAPGNLQSHARFPPVTWFKLPSMQDVAGTAPLEASLLCCRKRRYQTRRQQQRLSCM
jgi:hypothetical protein